MYFELFQCNNINNNIQNQTVKHFLRIQVKSSPINTYNYNEEEQDSFLHVTR